MTFTAQQIRKLRTRVRQQHVRQREADGKILHYLEGWFVVSQANRIFGHDGWDRETVASQCVWQKQTGSGYAAAYLTRVRVSVRAGIEMIVREGSGAGEATAPTPGQAHERAAKAAETDATKRALSTFGAPFGLALYGSPPEAAPAPRRELRPVTAAAGSGSATGTPPQQPSEMAVRPPQPVGAPRSEPATAIAAPRLLSAQETEQAFLPVRVPKASAPLPNGTGLARIEKSVLAWPEPRRQRDAEHLRFVARQPCLVCGRTPSHAHHVRFAQPRAMARKVSDEFTVPLCAAHHHDLHARGDEQAWWVAQRVEPLPIAAELWTASHDDGPWPKPDPLPTSQGQAATPEPPHGRDRDQVDP